MLKILYILPIFLFVIAGENQTNSIRKLQPRIWGGKGIDISSAPFYVALDMPYGMFEICGGTLISRSFVLTAAHCTIEVDKTDLSWKTAREISVLFGMSKNYPDSYNMTVYETGILIHKSYDFLKLLNDIALIKLPREATLNPYVQVANLPSINKSIDNVVGLKLFSVGWGRKGDAKNKKPTELQHMETQIVPGEYCIHPTYNFFYNDKDICVNAVNKSICLGDSGSPNVIFATKPILIGISTKLLIPLDNAKTTCEAGLPQMLTRVSYYLPWIHELTNISISNNENELL